MTQSEINHAVAKALGEEIAEVLRRGFSLLEPPFFDLGCDQRDPQVIDWDEPDEANQVASFYEVAV